MKKLAAFLVLLSLAACATPEEIAARKARLEQEDIDTCKSYGLKPGSEAFGMCRLQLDLSRQQQYDARYYAPYPPLPSHIYYYRP
ncbi:MAG: hypothetical protein SFX19_00510 [Alphaproteobacteria bacterium]|nr:hypothetical protein [Alphaproteobacteria bacterium]